jgi:xanthine permease XanP
MRKPPQVVYGPLDVPPLRVTLLSGLQHVALMGIYLVYPVLVAQAAGSPPEVAAAMVSLTLVAIAIGSVLQVVPVGPFGSGFLCMPTPTIVYLVPSLAAAAQGGLPLVFGMTLFAGLVELGLGRILGRLRAYFPPEIAGLVSLLLGIATGVIGLRAILGPDAIDGSGPGATGMQVALVTLVVMVALNVWARGSLRMFCVLLGLGAGTVHAWFAGMIGADDVAGLSAGPLVALPDLGHLGWTFDASMLGPFAVAGAVAMIKVMGNVASCQLANDAEWTRPDLRSVERGVLADGLTTMVSAAIGAPGVNSSTGAVGLATATGVHSRRIAWSVAGVLLLLAFVPKLGLLLNALPAPVTGAALVFSSTFIVVNGLQILGARLLDARRTLVIGLAIVFGLAVDLFPDVVAGLPSAIQPMLGSPLMLGAALALGLNLMFRVGARETETLVVPAGPVDLPAVRAFMEARGAAWGARRDVVERASFSLAQAIETIAGSGVARGPIVVAASFDEFNLDLRLSYDGPALEFPEQRPSVDDILASEEGERRLAGYMLRQCADRVSAARRGERATVLLHFVH